MEQRDILKDEIDQIGKAIAQVITKFLGLKTIGEIMPAIEITNEQFKTELNIDIEVLLQLEKLALQEYLKAQKIPHQHYELLADYLKETGLAQMSILPSKSITYLNKSLELLNLVDEVSNSISFERNKEQIKLAILLKELHNTQ